MKPNLHPLFRPVPGIRRRLGPCLAAAALMLSLSACSQTQIREERYPDGAKKSQSAYLRAPGNTRHGLQVEWYPSGRKASLETWVHGYRQGYSMRWYPDGSMKSVDHYTDGIRDGQSKAWDEAGTLIACSSAESGDCMAAASAKGPSAEENGAARLAARP